MNDSNIADLHAAFADMDAETEHFDAGDAGEAEPFSPHNGGEATGEVEGPRAQMLERDEIQRARQYQKEELVSIDKLGMRVQQLRAGMDLDKVEEG
jgi:hypothetical protein